MSGSHDLTQRRARVRSSYTEWDVTSLNYTDRVDGLLPLHGQVQQAPTFSTAELAIAVGIGYRVRVTNTGKRPGSYVALAFVSPPNATTDGLSYQTVAPKKQLFGFERVTLAPEESQVVDFLLHLGDGSASRSAGPTISSRIGWSSASVDVAGKLAVYPGEYKVQVTDCAAQYFHATGGDMVVGSQI